jgi:broad specificity phosphatase PhoE
LDHRYPSLRITLVRHAQARATDDTYDERTPLSALGRRQAASTAQALLARDRPVAVYCSPFPRCLETARPLCEALGLEPIFDRRLAEFEFETQNQTLAAVLEGPDLLLWDSLHRGRPGGETLGEFSVRVYRCLEELAERHLGSAVVLFTHSGVIDAAIRWSVGLAPEAPWIHDCPLSNASVTELELWPRGRVSGGGPRYSAFRRVAEITHLQDCYSDM